MLAALSGADIRVGPEHKWCEGASVPRGPLDDALARVGDLAHRLEARALGQQRVRGVAESVAQQRAEAGSPVRTKDGREWRKQARPRETVEAMAAATALDAMGATETEAWGVVRGATTKTASEAVTITWLVTVKK